MFLVGHMSVNGDKEESIEFHNYLFLLWFRLICSRSLIIPGSAISKNFRQNRTVRTTSRIISVENTNLNGKWTGYGFLPILIYYSKTLIYYLLSEVKTLRQANTAVKGQNINVKMCNLLRENGSEIVCFRSITYALIHIVYKQVDLLRNRYTLWICL